MLDERVLAARLRRSAVNESLVRVGGRELVAPLVDAEGRIGDHHIELHQVALLDEARRADRVAPFDARRVGLAKEHIHLAERPRMGVQLLSEEREIAALDLLARAEKQRARAAAGIADGVAFLGIEDHGEELRDFFRRVELAARFA